MPYAKGMSTCRNGHDEGRNQRGKCKGCIREQNQRSYGRHKATRDEEKAEYRRANAERIKTQKREAHMKLKREVIAAYGGRCACECGCEVSTFETLQLDHINNDGVKWREEHGRGSASTEWRRHRDAGYPPGILQVLCANCHSGKSYHGGCKGWK